MRTVVNKFFTLYPCFYCLNRRIEHRDTFGQGKLTQNEFSMDICFIVLTSGKFNPVYSKMLAYTFLFHIFSNVFEY